MLISFIFQFFGNRGPFLSTPPHKINQSEVLLLRPILLQLGRIQMIEPPLTALLRSPKIFPRGLNEQSLSQIAPLEPVIIALDQLLEQLVLLMDPLLVLVVLLQ